MAQTPLDQLRFDLQRAKEKEETKGMTSSQNTKDENLAMFRYFSKAHFRLVLRVEVLGKEFQKEVMFVCILSWRSWGENFLL